MLHNKMRIAHLFLAGASLSQAGCQTGDHLHNPLNSIPMNETYCIEKQITRGPGGRILTNTGVWSPDGDWLVYDTRSDPAGDNFDGKTIEVVNIRTGETPALYRATNCAHCGLATVHPRE